MTQEHGQPEAIPMVTEKINKQGIKQQPGSDLFIILHQCPQLEHFHLLKIRAVQLASAIGRFDPFAFPSNFPRNILLLNCDCVGVLPEDGFPLILHPIHVQMSRTNIW